MISKENAAHYTWGEGCDGWRLVAMPDLSVIHERMLPHTAEVRHHHGRARQLFFVLSGTAVLEVAGHREVLRAHQGCEVAPGLRHQIANESEQDVEFLVVSQPTTLGDRFDDAPAPLREQAGDRSEAEPRQKG